MFLEKWVKIIKMSFLLKMPDYFLRFTHKSVNESIQEIGWTNFLSGLYEQQSMV